MNFNHPGGNFESLEEIFQKKWQPCDVFFYDLFKLKVKSCYLKFYLFEVDEF